MAPSQSVVRPGLLTEAADSDRKALAMIKVVCLDIDDTLSTHGKLTSEAYSALWDLKKAGYGVVPITGRPAGWCDHIARFWPVDAVIGENGAFAFFMKDGKLMRQNTPLGLPSGSEPQLLLNKLRSRILAEFPHAKWASDQAYREFDLAIDFCEDVPAWPEREVERLVALCHSEGAQAKVSSIHVNTWFGQYTKKQGFENWRQKGAPGLDRGRVPDHSQWLFIGDSPNDEPMFEYFEQTVGVANLARFISQLKHPPRYLTNHESGAGFVEMVRFLLCLQGGGGAAR